MSKLRIKVKQKKPKLKDHATMHVYPSDLPKVHKLQKEKKLDSTKDALRYLLGKAGIK